MDLLQELTTLKADYSAAQSLLEEAKASSEALSKALAQKESTFASLNESLADKEGEIDVLHGMLGDKETAIAALKAEINAMAAKEKTAEEKAVEIVANVGIKPMKADYSAEAVAMDKAQVIAGMHAIKDPVERANFYFKNKATLFGIGGK